MKQKYKILLFDLDGTLIDNRESIKYAFEKILVDLNIEYNDDYFEEFYKFDFDYWHNLNPVTPDYIITQKEKNEYYKIKFFYDFFQDRNISYEQATHLEEKYYSILGDKVVSNKNAIQMIKKLNDKYKIIIATNGEKNSAHRKIVTAGLNKYISNIISSEDCGFSKPNREFFDYVLSDENSVLKEEVLMIGDTVLTDIKGGIDSNIDTCWYNEKKLKNKYDYNPTYEINDLKQLEYILD